MTQQDPRRLLHKDAALMTTICGLMLLCMAPKCQAGSVACRGASCASRSAAMAAGLKLAMRTSVGCLMRHLLFAKRTPRWPMPSAARAPPQTRKLHDRAKCRLQEAQNLVHILVTRAAESHLHHRPCHRMLQIEPGIVMPRWKVGSFTLQSRKPWNRITLDGEPAVGAVRFGTAALPALALLTVVALFCFLVGPAAQSSSRSSAWARALLVLRRKCLRQLIVTRRRV